MISTIFIDTEKERLFPMAGNTREAVTEFIKNQIDLSIIALANPTVVCRLQPQLSNEQIEAVISKLLELPLVRREFIGPYAACVEEIFETLAQHKDFIISGWSAVYNQEKLPAVVKTKQVVHSFGETLERDFQNICQTVIHIGSEKAISLSRSTDIGRINNL